jgi:transcriptional regulator with XRE-family HTH domain
MQQSKPDLLKIGNIIKTIREEKKIERKVIASQMQLTTQAYGNIENGKTDFSITHLLQLVDALKEPSDKILGISNGNTYHYTATNNKGGTYVQHVHTMHTINEDIMNKLFELVDVIKK